MTYPKYLVMLLSRAGAKCLILARLAVIGWACAGSPLAQAGKVLDAARIETGRDDIQVVNESSPVIRVAPSPVEPGSGQTRDLYVAYEAEDRGAPETGFNLYLKFKEPVRENYQPKFKATDARGRTWRVKLGDETFSEPVNQRIFWALGFPVDHSYHRKHFRVSFDRRFGELNQGAANWRFVEAVTFRAPEQWATDRPLSADQRRVRDRLLAKFGADAGAEYLLTRAELLDALDLGERWDVPRIADALDGGGKYASLVDALVLSHASLEVRPRKQNHQIIDGETVRLGQWQWSHPPLKDDDSRSLLRGLYVLHAWIFYTDTKNSQLKTFLQPLAPGAYRYALGFSDLGGPSHATLPPELNVHGFRFRDYDLAHKPDPTTAWEGLTLNDGQRVAQLLNLLDSQDMGDLLAAGGYSCPDFWKALDRMIRRKNHIVSTYYIPGYSTPIPAMAGCEWRTRSGRWVPLEE